MDLLDIDIFIRVVCEHAREKYDIFILCRYYKETMRQQRKCINALLCKSLFVYINKYPYTAQLKSL